MKFAVSSTKYPFKYLRLFRELNLGNRKLITTTKTREKLWKGYFPLGTLPRLKHWDRGRGH